MSIKRFYIQMIIMAVCALLASCGHRGQEDANTWKVYFPKADYSSINSEERRIVPEDNTDTAGMLIRALSEQPSDADGVPALPESIRPLGYSLSERHVDIDFPAAYLDMEKTSEILVRASVVETLTQDPEVVSVAFLVEGEELKDDGGSVIGDMNADSFINNTGVELNSYARTNVTLYFTDINGTILKRYDEDLVYNTNISMEKFALETLIGGPSNVNEQVAFPTLSPETKLLSVTIKDRIAYANFDASVKEKPYNVSEEVALYSIVNTLTTLPGIDKVQISIEGSTEGVFMEKLKLDSLYERNDEIIR